MYLTLMNCLFTLLPPTDVLFVVYLSFMAGLAILAGLAVRNVPSCPNCG